MDPRAGLDMCGKSRPTGIRSPDRPACSQSLYRLRYPANCSVVVLTKISFSQNTTIYAIMQSLLHVSVTGNRHQADISVHGHDMFSATVVQSA